MKSIPYMADTLPTGLVQTKKADETLDRQTEKIRGAEGIRSPITYYIYPSFVPPNFIYANL